MYIKSFVKFIFIGVLSASFILVAQANAEEQNTSVVVLDLQRAIMMTDAAKEKIKALEGEKNYAETQKKAESLRQDMMKKQEALQKDGATWAVEKRNTYIKDMEFMRKDFELVAQKLQAENQAVMRSLMQEMEVKVKGVLEQLIKDKKITVVLDKSVTVFADRSVDVTEELTARLNQVK